MAKEFDLIDVTTTGQAKIDQIRAAYKRCLLEVREALDMETSRELSAAITEMEKSCFFAVRAACLKHELPRQGEP